MRLQARDDQVIDPRLQCQLCVRGMRPLWPRLFDPVWRKRLGERVVQVDLRLDEGALGYVGHWAFLQSAIGVVVLFSVAEPSPAPLNALVAAAAGVRLATKHM